MSLLCALLAIALSGAGLVSLGFSTRARGARSLSLRCALALVLGLGTWSAGYAACLLTVGPRARTAKDLALAAAFALVLFLRRGRPLEPALEGPRAPRWLIAFFALACAVASLLVVEHVARFPDGGWDAWMIWNLRARALARAGDGFRSAFSPDLLFWAHQDYPFLLPGVVAQGFLLLGSESRLIPASAAFLLAVLAVLVLGLGLSTLRDARWGLLGGLALVTTPCLLAFTANQQSDVPMGLFLLTATTLLALALEDPARPAGLLLLAGFAAGLSAWTKNVGLVYTACLAAALVLRLRDLRAAALFLLGFSPFAALLAGFKLLVAHQNDLLSFSSRQDLAARAFDLHRWAELGLITLRRVVYFQDFALWLLAEVLVLVLVIRRLPPRPAPRVLGSALLFACAAYAPMYILQPHPLVWFFRASIDRLFIHLWPAALLATLLSLSTPERAPAPAEARART